jgi:hypothetical protein
MVFPSPPPLADCHPRRLRHDRTSLVPRYPPPPVQFPGLSRIFVQLVDVALSHGLRPESALWPSRRWYGM